MKKMMLITALAMPLLVSGMLQAAVTEQEAKALGTTLTPTGAEQAGNADGSIPAWSGKWLGAPSQVKYDGKYNPDPYADEKPLFTITAQNVAQYADKLGEGQKALFKQYPETFRINVYPTHRDFRYTDAVNSNVRLNATSARLENNGLSLKGAYGGPAFPIPKNGLEIIYNHLTAAGPYFIQSPQITAYVQANGSIAWSEIALTVFNPSQKGDARAKWDDGFNGYAISAQRAPPRDAGTVTLTWSSNDFVEHPRQGWQYQPGTRRMRKTPDVAFDYPMTTAPRVVDEQNGFNGSPERFEWTLIGKQEIYVPFHTFRLEDRALKYKDLIGTAVGHPNPEHIRHELRRVWVVEGSLRPGVRHIYSKRRFYIEEDSWNKVMGDSYDRQGQLWRVSADGIYYAYDANAYFNNVSIYQDLRARSFSIEKMSNELPTSNQLNRREPQPNEFSPDGIRRGGT